jgi:hypothetical protein
MTRSRHGSFLIPNASGASTAQLKRKKEAVRAKPMQANPMRRPRIKRRSPLAASVLPLASSRSHARVTGESYSRARAIRSPSLPRQHRKGKVVFPLVLVPILIGRNDLSSTNLLSKKWILKCWSLERWCWLGTRKLVLMCYSLDAADCYWSIGARDEERKLTWHRRKWDTASRPLKPA